MAGVFCLCVHMREAAAISWLTDKLMDTVEGEWLST